MRTAGGPETKGKPKTTATVRGLDVNTRFADRAGRDKSNDNIIVIVTIIFAYARCAVVFPA